LAILVVLAILLRLEPILIEPSAVWPDEIFQTTEPAHRLVYGSGLVALEFQLGVRSWLLPGIVAARMELSRLVGNGRLLAMLAGSGAFMTAAGLLDDPRVSLGLALALRPLHFCTRSRRLRSWVSRRCDASVRSALRNAPAGAG
jgi:hypothetical protein